MNWATLDELLIEDYILGRRPQARHRASGRARTGLRSRATATLATAWQAARDALTDAVFGSGTPAGGITLLAGQWHEGRTL